MTTMTADEMLADARREVAQEAELGQATGELLDAVEEFTARYVALGAPEAGAADSEAVALALWVLHTWTAEAADATPYVILQSETPRCGKTRLIETLKLLVRRPWQTASCTEAALFRKMEAEHPTLLLDEVDAVFGAGAREPLRAVLNAGNRRGSCVTRAQGKSYREFPVFGPKLLAGIDNQSLPDTIRDRGVVIRMYRREDAGVERFRVRRAEHDAGPLAWALQQWGQVATPILAQAEPKLPEALGDRQADAWEPLLAIAEWAGPEWAERARRAAVALSGQVQETVDPAELRERIKQVRDDR